MASKDKIEKLEDLIKDSIGGELIEQKAVPLLPLGENYGSVMYKVDFKVRKDGEEKEYHAVAKCTPPNQMTQELFNTQESFKAEIAWYTMVIPTLKQFSKKQGLRRELDFFQNFYGARISLDPNSDQVDLDGVILSENLKYLGYYNVDRHVGFDAPTTLSVLRDLATFHAVPLALRLKDPALFEKNVNSYCSKFAITNLEMKAHFDQDVLDMFQYLPETEPYFDRIEKVVKQSQPFGKREIREPWMTIVHVDFWCNNIMVTGGENSKNMILDLQVPMPGSAVGDLVFLLLTSVQLDIIKERFDEFIRFYYDEFIKNLKELNVDTKDFTFQGMLEEIDLEMKSAEFSHGLGHSLVILMEKGVANFDSSDPNFTTDQFEQKKPPPNQKQIEKFRWITSEALKRNWI